MKITSISITYRRVFNLGDYNSAAFEETITAEIGDDDNPSVCQDELWRQARTMVQAQALPVVRPRQEQLQQAFDSLPDTVKEAILANRM